MAHSNNKVSSSIEEIKGDGSGEFEETIEEFEESNTKESKDTQLSSHDNVKKVLEWIPYDRFHNIEYIAKYEFGEVYRANWIDGNIFYWDNENQNWKRKDHNMFVNLKNLNTPNNIVLELTNKINIEYKIHGITQNPKTKNYMIVLDNICDKCNHICYAIHFQQNFKTWTSGNYNIDKLIQNSQLSGHTYYSVKYALEWIPYNRFYDIKYIAKDESYRANWIDGNISYWNDENQNWKRENYNMFVILKSLDTPKHIINEIENEA
uniref:Uncharacterized protein n=1 Tax=Rhizophagus irregularis (strain DAOM 181602 / DAOM 197198 / MUCL 43194) TaxID=747089 RepID=U9ULD8_RHIID